MPRDLIVFVLAMVVDFLLYFFVNFFHFLPFLLLLLLRPQPLTKLRDFPGQPEKGTSRPSTKATAQYQPQR
jgi:hypothetical protein